MALIEKTVQIRGFQFVPATADEIELKGSEARVQEDKIKAELPGFSIMRVEIKDKRVWSEDEDNWVEDDSLYSIIPSLSITQILCFDDGSQRFFHTLLAGQWLVEDSADDSGYSVLTESDLAFGPFRML